MTGLRGKSDRGPLDRAERDLLRTLKLLKATFCVLCAAAVLEILRGAGVL